MSGREVKPGGASLTDVPPAHGAAAERPGATTLVQREGQRTQPVPSALRSRIEAATGAKLGDVRLHTGPAAHAKAEAHGARAITIGQDIYFRDGESINGAAGEELVAHEVAHTVQNRKSGGGTGDAAAGTGMTSPNDAGENEARDFAEAIVGGGKPPPLVESLGDAVGCDVLITSNDLAKKATPADQFSGPVTWSVIGDSFEVRLHRIGDELVTDITYLGTYPVDSYQMPSKADPTRMQRVKTRRRTPPEDRKNLPYVTKLMARSSNTLTFDLFGDGIELLVVRDNCDPEQIAKFDRRTHRIAWRSTVFRWTPPGSRSTFATGDGEGRPEGDREAIGSRKIKLLQDEFTLRARRHGDSDSVVLGIVHTMRQFPPLAVGGRYRGGHLSSPGMGGGMGADHVPQDPHYVHEVAATASAVCCSVGWCRKCPATRAPFRPSRMR